jgi:hypothetical protein
MVAKPFHCCALDCDAAKDCAIGINQSIIPLGEINRQRQCRRRFSSPGRTLSVMVLGRLDQ